jgi:hypothetical protein
MMMQSGYFVSTIVVAGIDIIPLLAGIGGIILGSIWVFYPRLAYRATATNLQGPANRGIASRVTEFHPLIPVPYLKLLGLGIIIASCLFILSQII